MDKPVTQEEIVDALLRTNVTIYSTNKPNINTSELADRIQAYGIAPPDSVISAIADLQPLAHSQNRADRLWQMYNTPEECVADIKKTMLAAAPTKERDNE